MKQELIIDYTENMDELQKARKYMLWKKARKNSLISFEKSNYGKI